VKIALESSKKRERKIVQKRAKEKEREREREREREGGRERRVKSESAPLSTIRAMSMSGPLT